MNELLELIKTRRSIRRFKPEAPPQESLDLILEAGLYAPSGRGTQNPIILQVTNPQLRSKLVTMNREIGGWEDENFDPFYGAPVILIVLGKKDMPTRVYDGSLVMENLMLAAWSLGIGSCWIHRAKEEFETPWGKDLLKSLGITEEYEGIGHLALGYIEGNSPQAAARDENRLFYLK